MDNDLQRQQILPFVFKINDTVECTIKFDKLLDDFALILDQKHFEEYPYRKPLYKRD